MQVCVIAVIAPSY